MEQEEKTPVLLACDLMPIVARMFGVTVPEIKGGGRNRHLIGARSVITMVLREHKGLSYPIIGKIQGGKDHTTIMHQHKTFHAKARKFPHWAEAHKLAVKAFYRD